MTKLKETAQDGSESIKTAATIAAIAGAIAGAAFVIAGATILNNEKNKTKLNRFLDELKIKMSYPEKKSDSKIDSSKTKIKKINKADKKEIKKANKRIVSKK